MNEGSELQGTIFALVRRALPPSCDEDTITLGTNLRRGLGLDSLEMASFLFRCGEGLGVDPDTLIELIAEEPIQTVGDVVALGTRVMRPAKEGALLGPGPREP